VKTTANLTTLTLQAGGSHAQTGDARMTQQVQSGDTSRKQRYHPSGNGWTHTGQDRFDCHRP